LTRLVTHVHLPIVNRTKQANRFSGSTAPRLANGYIDGLLLLSPRTAPIYTRLIKLHDLTASAREMTYFCISEATAAELKEIDPAKVEIAAEPNLQEVLALTARTAPQLP